MIVSFGNSLASDLFDDLNTKATRAFPSELRRIARRKLLYLHDASDLQDMRMPPGNRLEKLIGDWQGYHSVRINQQWRLVFKWDSGSATNVQIVDYHQEVIK